MKVVRVLMIVAIVASVMPAVASAQEAHWVKVDCGTVVKSLGNTVVVRLDSTNKTKVYKNVSPDIHFVIDGNKNATVYDLREGMHACAYREEEGTQLITVEIEPHEVESVVDEPDQHDAPPPAPRAAPAPAPKPAPAPMLPKTGSQLPLAGLAGLLLLAVSAGIAVLRRI